MDTNNINPEMFMGKNGVVYALGVVEDNVDPLTLGRVKVRCFGFHPQDRSAVPTTALPWATVLQSSASTSGVGFSPNYLKPDSWVFVIFMDGETAQFPVVLGSIPRLHLPSAPGQYLGNSGAGYRPSKDGGGADSVYSGGETAGPYSNATPTNPSGGSTIKDDGAYITKQNISNWPFKTYKHTPARGDFGLACKDSDSSLRIHYASVLALEELGKRWGKNPRLNSAYRTPAYNATLQGAAKHSQHIEGRAFDIRYDSIGGGGQANISKFAQTAVQCGFVGFGLYPSFIHIDTGKGRTWNGAKAGWFVSAIKAAGWYPGKPGLSDVKVADNSTANNAVANTTSSNTSSSSSSTQGEPKTTAETRDYADNYLKEQGYTPEQRAAILANMQHESGFNPGATGDGGNAHGLFQWNSRAGELNNFASSRGLDASKASTQMQFFTYETTHGESTAGNALRNATTVEQANSAMRSYERYANGPAEEASRLATARGILGGENNTANNPISPGFQDVTGSLPYGNYKGKPSTHHAARGLNGNLFQPELQKNNDSGLTGFPVAGDKGTIGEVEMAEAPQYPYNFVYGGLSGHMFEIDDTPGVERVNLQHRSGSRLVMASEGSAMMKSQGNFYSVTGGDNNTMVLGNYRIVVKDDLDIRSTSDITMHSDGSMTLLIRNDAVEHVSGKKDILVADTLQIKAKRIIIEADNIDMVAHENITMEAGGNITMRSGKTMSTSATDTKMFSSGSFDADAGSMKWLEGEAKEVPEMTGKSSDLGKAPPRAKVEKSPYKRKNSDITAGLNTATAHYAPSDPTKRTTEI